jgi:hypothetical protein
MYWCLQANFDPEKAYVNGRALAKAQKAKGEEAPFQEFFHHISFRIGLCAYRFLQPF